MIVTQPITDLVHATYESKSKPRCVFCPDLQKDSTVLSYDCLLYEGEGFCIFPRRLKVDFQVQVLRKGVKKNIQIKGERT